MARIRPSWSLEQGRFVGTWDPHEEVMLELTVPLAVDRELFRVGWSLKGLGRTGWIAISTGEEKWSRFELLPAAMHVANLMGEARKLVNGDVERFEH